jgi:class 3 adenylate cyclase
VIPDHQLKPAVAAFVRQLLVARGNANVGPGGEADGTVTFLFTDIEESTRQWEADASPTGRCGRQACAGRNVI